MPLSKYRNDFSQNGHRIWIQHGKLIGIDYLDVFFLSPDDWKFTVNSGAREEPWTGGGARGSHRLAGAPSVVHRAGGAGGVVWAGGLGSGG